MDVPPFELPAHASLTPVVVRTRQGCKVEIIFLGVDFFGARVELNLCYEREASARGDIRVR